MPTNETQKLGWMTYEDAKKQLIAGLECDAIAHTEGRFADIGKGFDSYDIGLPRGAGPEFDKLHVALNFWDGWIDARNHMWLYYEPIVQADWPKLAKSIVEDIVEDRNLTNPLVIQHFDFSTRTSFFDRLKQKFSGEQR
jgi:hypothetical protein